MKPQQTARLLATVASAAAAAPLLAIAGLGAGLLWLLFREKKPEQKPTDSETLSKPGNVAHPKASKPPVSAPPPVTPPVSAAPTPSPVTMASQTVKRVTREDLAEALAYGARLFTRKEAVEELETLGFRKTAAYKALSADGKFGSLIEFTPDGLIEWKG